ESEEVVAGAVALPGPTDVLERARAELGGGRRREHEGPRAVPEEGAERRRAGDEGALRADGLAERPDEDIGHDPVLGAAPRALGTEHPERVGFVDDEE